MARINNIDSQEFFGFEKGGQGLAGALVEAGRWLESDHPSVERVDQRRARVEYRADEETFYVVLPYKEGKP